MKLTLYKPSFHTWMLALESKDQKELDKFVRICLGYRHKWLGSDRQFMHEWQFFWQVGSYPRPDGFVVLRCFPVQERHQDWPICFGYNPSGVFQGQTAFSVVRERKSNG